MTQMLTIIINLAFIGCIISLILSAHFIMKRKKEKANIFITLSIIYAFITAIMMIFN